MTYLVDANVLSEPTKPTPDLRVVAWLRAHERDIAVDPIILGELRFGIAPAAKRQETNRARGVVRRRREAAGVRVVGCRDRDEVG